MAGDEELIRQLNVEVKKLTGKKLNRYGPGDKDKKGSRFTMDQNGHVKEIALRSIKNMAALLPIIVHFQHLESLYLINCGLTDIYILKELKELTSLDLKGNQISDISILKELKGLTYLDIGRNQISNISILKELKRLKTLYLNNNQVSDISSLKELKELLKLSLGGIQISDISNLKELKGLKELHLYDNQIKDISILKEPKGLSILDLSSNHISDISSLLELKQLTHLDLQYNKITKLPSEALDLGLEIKWEREYKANETGLFLAGNPLESPPPEIVKKGTQAVREYFKALTEEKGEKQALREVKVLLVGDGAAGKTSLVKRLRGFPFDKNESQTHGINIAAWDTGSQDAEIHVRLWDFGGQEIMHATHQFFLSKRSLYILVLDCRKDEKTEYWLNHVHTFGGASPVLVVLNKMDENPGFDVNRRFLQEKYPFIKGFYPVSCASGDGIDTFIKALNTELASVELLRTTWAKNWFRVKTRLEDMTDHFISYDRFREICREEQITGTAGQDTLVDYLNDLGVILHFKDFHLQETQVLEPRWITTAVYRIINSPLLAAGHGVLSLKSLKEILKPVPGEQPAFRYPADKYPYIIQLMKKFELCYILDDDRILVPDLLAVAEPPIESRPGPALAFRFRYPFLPKSIMPRFIVKRHQDIKNELRWRTGVVLENTDCDALAVVKADEREQTISISVTGTRKRDCFAIIRDTFREIHGSFEKLAVEEWIPLPDNPGHAVEYTELLGYEEEGRDEIFIGKLRKSYSVAQLLSGIEKPEDRKKGVERIIEREIIREYPAPGPTPPVPAKKKRFPLIWKIMGGIVGLIGTLAALANVLDSQNLKKVWDWITGLFR